MPALRLRRHERFAQALASGKTCEEAYVEAGYKRDRHHAARVARLPHVAIRVRELIEMAVQTTVITRAFVMEELLKNANEARAAGKHSAAIRGFELLGKEIGMFVERQETGTPGSFKDLSDSDLERELYLELRQCGMDEASARAIAGTIGTAEDTSLRGKPN